MSASEKKILTLFSNLSRAEQWRMVVLMMQAMQSSEKELGISAQQQTEINQVIADYESGKTQTYTWEEAKAHIKNGTWRSL